MDETNHIANHDEFASTYDAQVKQYNSYGHAILFGMCYEYVQPGESLLDLGIGTGLSSYLFAKAGLIVTGLDASSEMLKECEKKGFAKEIRQYNIQDLPLPYPDNTFSHIICCGVFHFFADLLPIAKDTCRVLKAGGTFGFTIASLTANEAGTDDANIPDYSKEQSAWGIPIYKHSDAYINRVIETHGLILQKQQKVLADSGDESLGDILFKAIVTQKRDIG